MTTPALPTVAMKRKANGMPPKFAVTAAAAITIWRSAVLRLVTTA